MVRFGTFWLILCGIAASAGCATAPSRWSDTSDDRRHESHANCDGEHILVHASATPSIAPAAEGIAHLVEQARSFTVAVHAEKNRLLPQDPSGTTSDRKQALIGRVLVEGTGVVIDRSGLILTNYHVVRSVNTIRVWAHGRWLPARLVAGDAQSDLAVLSVRTQFPVAARLGDAGKASVGDAVMAVGYTPGADISSGPLIMGARLTGLRVSLQRALDPLQECNYADLLESTAALQPGHSGGPLVSANGEVIGINTASVTRSGDGGLTGYAIRLSPYVRQVVDRLSHGEHVAHGFLGLMVCHDTGSGNGVTVRSVVNHSPAARAGLQPGDVVNRYAGTPVRSAAEFTELVRASQPGQPVELQIRRGWKTVKLLCKPTVRP